LNNKLFITNDLEQFFQNLKESLQSDNIVLFDEEDFKITHARSLIEQAYLATPTQKFIIIKAKRYNEASQNAILKILEEPLEKVSIYLIGLSKSIFLPTIRSRLGVETKNYYTKTQDLDFFFDKLNLKKMYNFLINNNRFMDKNLAISYIDTALIWYKKSSLKLDEELLEFFGHCKRLIHLNSNPQSVILTLMLMLLKIQNGKA